MGTMYDKWPRWVFDDLVEDAVDELRPSRQAIHRKLAALRRRSQSSADWWRGLVLLNSLQVEGLWQPRPTDAALIESEYVLACNSTIEGSDKVPGGEQLLQDFRERMRTIRDRLVGVAAMRAEVAKRIERRKR